MNYQNTVDRMRKFYSGIGYLIFTSCVCFLGHALSLELVFLPILSLSLSLGFLICRDVKFAMLPLLTCVFIVSPGGYSPATGYERYFNNKIYLWFLAGCLALLLLTLFVFLHRNWKCRNQISWNAGFFAISVWCCGMLFNGAFHRGYSWKNIAFALTFTAVTLGIYLLFAAFLDYKESVFPYFISCLSIANFLLIAELILAFFTRVEFAGGGIVKESVILGWGVWTDIGGMLVFFMPICFYYANTSKYHGWLGYLLGFFEYFCILLTQSRGALLVGTLMLAICLLYLCFFGKKRKINRILTVSVAVLAMLFAAAAMPKILALVKNFLDDGMNDNGRFDLWLTGMKHFFENPIFGSGFYDSYTNPEWNTMGISPYLYHNTLVQMLGACGLVGFLAYVFHRVWTVRMVIRKPNELKTFLGFCILGLCLCSLLDVLMFKLYPSVYYALMLLMMEYSDISAQQPFRNY